MQNCWPERAGDVADKREQPASTTQQRQERARVSPSTCTDFCISQDPRPRLTSHVEDHDGEGARNVALHTRAKLTAFDFYVGRGELKSAATTSKMPPFPGGIPSCARRGTSSGPATCTSACSVK